MTAIVECTETEFINAVQTINPPFIHRSRRERWEWFTGDESEIKGLDEFTRRSCHFSDYGTRHYSYERRFRYARYDIRIDDKFYEGERYRDKDKGHWIWEPNSDGRSNLLVPMTYLRYGFVYNNTTFIYEVKVNPELVFVNKIMPKVRTEVGTKKVRKGFGRTEEVTVTSSWKVGHETHIYEWELPDDNDFALPFDMPIIEGELIVNQ